jgi:protein-tyrosine-phosphatase
MSESVQEQKKTIETPISREDLEEMARLQKIRSQIAEHLLELELERDRVKGSARGTEVKMNALFERILGERGLPQGFPIEVNASTGEITVVEEAVQRFMQQQAATQPVVDPSSKPAS